MSKHPEIETEPTRFLVPMTAGELARATGMARMAAANDDDAYLTTLADGATGALHVETDTEEGVVVRIAAGADAASLRSRLEALGGREELPFAA